MVNSRPAHRPPTRQRRSLRNDAVILDAAIRVTDEEGWGGLTPGHLADVTGLTRPTVLQRHADRSALGAAAWRERLAEPVLASLTSLMSAASGHDITAEALLDAFGPFITPDASMRAASELLIVAGYDSSLSTAVSETLGPSFTQWFTPVARRLTRTQAARNAVVVSMALGLVIEARRYGSLELDFTNVLDLYARAFNSPARPARLPATRAEYLDQPVSFETGEPAWDAALTATIECVGSMGYEAATIEAITAASGYTRTVIFSRYKSKQDLFIDATDRMLAAAVEPTVAYQETIAQTRGDGIAAACFVRETLLPERTRIRTVMLEQVRLTPHIDLVRESMLDTLRQYEAQYATSMPSLSGPAVRARLITDFAFTTGVAALAQLRTDIWNLPFDTVLVALRNHG